MDMIDRIISEIDSEINHLWLEQKRPGWTRWALAGSLCTCMWILLDILERKNYLRINIGIIFISISILFDMIVFLKKHLKENTWGIFNDNIRFEYSDHIFKDRRLYLIYDILRMLIIIIIAHNILKNNIGCYGFYLWYITEIVLSIIALAISIYEIPIPIIKKIPYSTRIFELLLFVFGCIGLFGLYIYYIEKAVNLNIQDLRISLIIIVITTLIGYIVKEEEESVLISRLRKIRRSLVLGELDIEKGKEQIDIALSGLTLSQVLQKDIDEIIGYMNEYIVRINLLIENLSSSNEIKNIEIYKPDIIFLDETMQLILGLINRIGKRINYMKAFSPKSTEDAINVINKIKVQNEIIELKYKSFREKYYKLEINNYTSIINNQEVSGDKKNNALNNRAKCYINMIPPQIEKAILDYRDACEIENTSSRNKGISHGNLGLLYFKFYNDSKMLLEETLKALDFENDQYTWRYNYGLAKLFLGDTKESIKYCIPAIKECINKSHIDEAMELLLSKKDILPSISQNAYKIIIKNLRKQKKRLKTTKEM